MEDHGRPPCPVLSSIEMTKLSHGLNCLVTSNATFGRSGDAGTTTTTGLLLE